MSHSIRAGQPLANINNTLWADMTKHHTRSARIYARVHLPTMAGHFIDAWDEAWDGEGLAQGVQRHGMGGIGGDRRAWIGRTGTKGTTGTAPAPAPAPAPPGAGAVAA